MIEQLDNSYTLIKNFKNMSLLKSMLTIEKDNWYFDYLIRIGKASKNVYFYESLGPNIKVYSGLLDIPHIRELLELPDIEFKQCPEIKSQIEDIAKLIPFEPYDYQIKAAIESITKEKCLSIMCTGSGKSLTIAMILEYFRVNNFKGALIVPNINLLTQFQSDIKSYGLLDVHKGIQKAGDGVKAAELAEDKFLLITTWQSLMNLDTADLNQLDFIICDEVHRFSSDCTSKLVLDSKNARFKLGFTGTLPQNKIQKMTILGLFGLPNYIISSKDLIDRGLGTNIKIYGYKLIHTAESDYQVSKYFDYLDRVKFLASLESRNKLIANLSITLSNKNLGSTLILYTLIEHGSQIFKLITELEEIPSLEVQNELGVFFMTGKVKAKDREFIRLKMDSNPKAILIANYSLLSTGVNIKSLRYAIFASPLKSYTAIVQSLGRGIRTSEGKDLFEVYDLADYFKSVRTFDNSFRARKKIYLDQQFDLIERTIKL